MNESNSLNNLFNFSPDKNLLFLSVYLLLFNIWMIYLIFLNARIVGRILSFITKKIFKNCHIKIGSISMCFLGGKIMIKDFVYCDENISIRCCYLFMVFNYWTTYTGEKDNPGKRSLKVGVYGLDCHIFNRIKVYEKLKELQKSMEENVPDKIKLNSISKRIMKAFPNLFKEKSQNFVEFKVQKMMKLFPCIKLSIDTAKFCAGNHLLPNALILNVEKFDGIYTLNSTRCTLDNFQHYLEGKYSNLTMSLVPVLKYSGQFLVEDPPKTEDKSFYLLKFEQGLLKYFQDEPGLIPDRENCYRIVESDVNYEYSYPRWQLDVEVVQGLASIKYGPWADRKREILWNFFFPSNYEETQVTDIYTPNSIRPFKELKIDLKFKRGVNLDILWLKDKNIRHINVVSENESSATIKIPFLVTEHGFTTDIVLEFMKPRMFVVPHVWSEVLRGEKLKIKLLLDYGLNWNSPVVWNVKISDKKASAMLLFDYKNFFKSLIEDWSKYSKSDLAKFVPYTYSFQFQVQNMELSILVNDYNWVSSTPENSIFSVSMEKFLFKFDLPFTDFLPEKVAININLKGHKIRAGISIPTTSTCLYTIKELHSHLRIVNQSGYLQKNHRFKANTKDIIFKNKKYTQNYFDVWLSPSATINICYCYHPQNLLPDYDDSLWHLYPASIQRLNNDHDKIEMKEEKALENLRPDVKNNHGPTHNQLIENDYDPTYLEADTVDVNFQLPSGQAVLYGPFIKALLMAKENYLGVHQTPVDMNGKPLGPEKDQIYDSLNKTDKNVNTKVSLIDKKNDRVIDPRTYRPYSAKITVNIHNIQAHLPYHSKSGEAPCPTLFIDCLAFEMDKRYHGTNLQLLLSPILLCIFDKIKMRSEKYLSVGRGQILGVQFRGEALFSNLGLPLSCDTLEYGWLMELIIGEISGQFTCPQIAILTQALNVLVNTVKDAENELIPSRTYNLCQHGVPEKLCPIWKGISLCPDESKLKYIFFRLTVDRLSLGLVENGTCLIVDLDHISLCRCNGHGKISKDGVIIVTSELQIVQYIKKLENSSNQEEALNNEQLAVKWIEGGRITLGPLQVIASIAPKDLIINRLQKEFLVRHDEKSKRLWFLWRKEVCGCFGGCQFFGENTNGRIIANELISKVYRKKATFRPLPNRTCLPKSYEFGESLIKPGSYIYELHNPLICLQKSNGFFGMRENIKDMNRFIIEKRNSKILQEISENQGALQVDKSITNFKFLCDSCQHTSDIDMDFNSNSGDEDESLGALDSSECESSLDFSSSNSLDSMPKNESDSTYNHEEFQHLLGNFDDPIVKFEKHKKKVRRPKRLPKPLQHFSKRKKKSTITEIEIEGKGDQIPIEDLSPRDRNEVISSCDDDNHERPAITRNNPPPPPPPRAFNKANIEIVNDSSGLTPFISELISHSDTDDEAGEEDEDSKSKTDSSNKVFYVELKNQLNRPIMDSALLRNAYARHLTNYYCIQNWNEPISYKRKWNVCQTVSMTCGDYEEDPDNMAKDNRQCKCPSRPFGPGETPTFLKSIEGFTPCCLISRPIIMSIPIESDDLDEARVDDETNLIDSDPIMQLYAPDIESSLKSSASIILEKSVEIFMSPLFVESMNRYVVHLIPLVRIINPSSVIDLFHSKCQNISKDRFIQNLDEDPDCLVQKNCENTDINKKINKINNNSNQDGGFTAPVIRPKVSSIRNSFRVISNTSLHKPDCFNSTMGMNHHELITKFNRKYNKIINFSDPVSTPVKDSQDKVDNKRPEDTPHREENEQTRSNTKCDTEMSCQKLTKLATFHVKQINIFFLQIYTVENVVEFESLESGLYDVTCVSLLTFGIDSLSIDLMSERDILSSPDYSPSGMRRINWESKHKHSNSESLSAIPLALDENLKNVTEKSPMLNQTMIMGELNNNRRHLIRGKGHSRQPSAPPILGNFPPEVFDTPKTYINPEVRSLNIESNKKMYKNLEKLSQSNENIVGNLTINRIHGQLRRLTKDTKFNSNILLNAIPFQKSKVFFSFPSDPNQSEVLKQEATANPLKKDKFSSRPSYLNMPQYQSNARVPVSQSCFDLEARTSGWIMLECGCEKINLTGINKKGCQDITLTCNEETVFYSNNKGDENNSRKMISHSTQTPSSSINSTHTSLNIDLIWFNFPSPRRLSNKRKIELIRTDWNFLSTFSPMINAWINPIDRLIAQIKNLKENLERRLLSVTICLITQASSSEVELTGFDHRQRLSCLEDEIDSQLARKRSPDALNLRFDASCQIFILIRRYLQAYRQNHTDRKLDHKLELWLRPSVIPETDFLRRCILALTCEMKLMVDDISITSMKVPKNVTNNNFNFPLNFDFKKTLNNPDKLISTRIFSIFSSNLPKSDLTSTTMKLNNESSDEQVKLDEVDHPQETTDLLSNDANDVRQQQDKKEIEPSPFDYEIDHINRREVDRLDEQSREVFKKNPIMKKFLVDSWNYSNSKNLSQVNQSQEKEQEEHLARKKIEIHESDNNEDGEKKVISSSTLKAGQNKQEDRFWSLLEVVGLNTKGVRRTTLMRKFDGRFIAKGLLEAFQIEIIKSIENPLNTTVKASSNTSHIANSESTAFLCQNFRTELILRDMEKSQKKNLKKKSSIKSSKKFDITETTTHIDLMLDVKCIKNHFNMALFRLIHQISTMTNTAQDTRSQMKPSPFSEKPINSLFTNPSRGSTRPSSKFGHKKNSSYESSDATNQSTFNSQKTDSIPDPVVINYSGVQYNRFIDCEANLNYDTNRSSSHCSQNSSGKTSYHLNIDPGTGAANFIKKKENEKKLDGKIPTCWQRLYSYFEYYNTVPQTIRLDQSNNNLKSVLKKKDEKYNSKEYFSIVNEKPRQQNKENVVITNVIQHNEHTPYVLFVTMEIHETIVTAVLSELKLQANLGNILASISVSKRVQNFPRFQSKSLESSLTGHCGGCKIRLIEGIRPQNIEVASVQVAKSNCLFSYKQNVNQSINDSAVFVNLGNIKVKLPHHPVRLHGVVQRQAKRITNTMSEFIRPVSSNQGQQTPLFATPTENFTPSFPHSNQNNQVDGIFFTPCGENQEDFVNPVHAPFGSCNNSFVDDNNTIISSMKNQPALTNYSQQSQTPLAFNIMAVAQGCIINVALHPSLNAIYDMKPVYFVGKMNQFICLDFVLKNHSLMLQSSVESRELSQKSQTFSKTVTLDLPRIFVSIIQKNSSGGHFSRMDQDTKKSNLIKDLTSEEGIFYDIQASIGYIDQTLTTDMLNYILVVAKLFMKEINEVIQKMSGEELMDKKFVRSLSLKHPEIVSPNNTNNSNKMDSCKIKFSSRIQLQGIRLLATTVSGCLKLETSEIGLELSNRVFKSQSRHANDGSLFIYCVIDKLGVDMGQMINDPVFNEINEFNSLAFVKTSVEMRSLFADEIAKTGEKASSKFDESFLLSLNRPLVCLKPSAIDRALLLWFVYKTELIKWNKHIQLLSASVPNVETVKKQASVKEIPITHSGTTTNSRIFIQLNIKDFGFALPINSVQKVHDPFATDFDSRNALILTINQSRLSGCLDQIFVCDGEFSEFCLRFFDDFNVDSDDWAPNLKEFSFQHGNSREVMILNAVTVPKGTFQVIWKTPEEFDKDERSSPWILAPQLKISGVDIHLDTEFGSRIKALFSTFTNMNSFYNDFVEYQKEDSDRDESFVDYSIRTEETSILLKRNQTETTFEDIQVQDDDDQNISDSDISGDERDSKKDEQTLPNNPNVTMDPSLMVQVRIQIDIDAAKCVLHPKLQKNIGYNPFTHQFSPFNKRDFSGTKEYPNGVNEQSANKKPNELTPDEKLIQYFKRYQKSFCEDPLQKLSDITFLYLPAVKIIVNYASKTDMDIFNEIQYTVNSQSQFESVSSHLDYSTVLPGMNKAKLNKIRKRADLYAFCSLKNLTEEWIVHPALLDFLEQIASNLPNEDDTSEFENNSVLSRQPQTPTNSSTAEGKAVHDSESEREGGAEIDANRGSSNNNDDDSIKSETFSTTAEKTLDQPLQKLDQFPVDVIFHFQTEPTKIRLLCLPESQMQCLLTLPSMSLVFSSKRNSDSEKDQQTSSEDEQTLEGGLCLTVLLKEFALAVFYPSTTEINDYSLTINVKNITLNISRTEQTKFISILEAMNTPEKNESVFINDPDKNQSTLHSKQTSLHRLRNQITLKTATGSSAFSKMIQQTSHLTVTCSIELAEFKCDTRRTLEILDIINAWYRRSLARLLILGGKTTQDFTDPERHVDDCSVSFVNEMKNSKADRFPVDRKNSISGQFNNWLEKKSNAKIMKKKAKTMAQKEKSTTVGGGGSTTAAKKSATVNPIETVEEDGEDFEENAESTSFEKINYTDRYPIGFWEAFPIFLINIKRFNVELFMGYALGVTNLALENTFCHGRVSINSNKRKALSVNFGFESCEFCSEQGTVGGEFSISDFESKFQYERDPESDPEHSIDAVLKGLQFRWDYMNTSLIFMRISNIEISLDDTWKFQQSNPFANSSNDNNYNNSNGADEKLENDEENSAFSNIISVQGHFNWDRLQIGISRTTTPDIIRSVKAVQEYFEKQLNDGRTSLLFGTKTKSALPMGGTFESSAFSPDSTIKHDGILALFQRPKQEEDRLKEKAEREQEKTMINKIYERHWQDPMICAEKFFQTHPMQKEEEKSNIKVPMVLSGSLLLSGNLISLACFAGSFRSAPDWAVFCIQHVTACFETESQRKRNKLDSSKTKEDSEGWLNIRQILSFELGAQPHFCPQVAYVLRIKKGCGDLLNQPSAYSLANWMEFMFLGADNSILNNLQKNHYNFLNTYVTMSEFGVEFAKLLTRKTQKDSSRSGPTILKPSYEVEVLFILPSISVRVVSDQEQPMGMNLYDLKSSNSTQSEGYQPIVNISFQTDFHGLIQLGLIDIPWLPSLISSYLTEHKRDLLIQTQGLNQDPSNNSVTMYNDGRSFSVIHWNLSPECRWLLATNVSVPAIDIILEKIGFSKARSTIPKWLQRGVMDNLDQILSGLVDKSLN